MKHFRDDYLTPYKVSQDVREEVSGFEIGIDAYTVVTDEAYVSNVLATKWSKYSDFAQKGGHKVKPFKMHQYSGWQVASVRYANKYSGVGSLLGVTGKMANSTYRDLLQFTLRATRVDIAATFFLTNSMPHYAEKIYEARQLMGAKWKVPIGQYKLIQGNSGDTLYVGKRGTGKYLRMYDKSYDYPTQGERGVVWRFEIEYSGGYAEGLWKQLAGYDRQELDIESSILKTLWGDCWNKGVALPVSVQGINDYQIKRDKNPPDKARYLTWLSSSVAPAVKWLIAMGWAEEVKEALGLQMNFMDILEQQEDIDKILKPQEDDKSHLDIWRKREE